MENDQERPAKYYRTNDTVSRGRAGGAAESQRSRSASSAGFPHRRPGVTEPRRSRPASSAGPSRGRSRGDTRLQGSRPAVLAASSHWQPGRSAGLRRSRSPASIQTAPYHSATATSLSTSSPSHSNLSSNPRTLRLSLIPTSVDGGRFRQYLAGLRCEAGVLDDNILAFSLAPYGKWLVATVAFRQEPLDLTECRSDRKCYVRLPPELDGATITVDCDFYGITPLYHPPKSEPIYDVIAVSGLSAHAFGSWKSPHQSYVMWLRDILPSDFPHFRVLTWGYESDLEDRTASMSIMSFSRQLLMAVHSARELAAAKNRPIIFVGHSLGGLIIKQALVDAAEGKSPNDKAILDSCVGMLLFGVPNRGLNNENLSSLVKDMKSAPFVEDLREDSELLRRLDRSFERAYQAHLKHCLAVSFYETKDTKTVQEQSDGVWARTGEPIRMVSQDSATCFIRAEEAHHQIPIVADHSRLVKFTGPDDHNYVSVRSKIQEILSTSNVKPLLLFARDCVQPDHFMKMLAKHDQRKYKSQIPALDWDDSQYYWITKNIDFTEWCEAIGSRTLWISGPSQKGIQRMSSYMTNAKPNASGTVHSVLYFFISAAAGSKQSISTICVQALLYQILLGLQPPEQKKAIEVFLNKTIDALIERKPALNSKSWEPKEDNFPNGTISRSLDVSSNTELWDALFAVLEIVRRPQLVIIDGLDQAQNQTQALVEGVRRFTERLQVKALLTSETHEEIVVSLRGVKCIAYDVERQECLNSLRFDNTRYEKIMGEHKGTLEWLWSHEEYREWSTSDTSRLLYVEGKPGSGKSTLTRYFKDHLLQREPLAKSAIIASFFYSFREGESQRSHYNMLRSILYDILNQDESFFYHFQQEHRKYQTWKLREEHSNLEKLHYQSLQRILRSVRCHQRKERLYFVIDAVDESTNEDRRNILRLLFELCSEGSCIMKVFVASRPVQQLFGRTPTIRMQEVNGSDIQRYVHSLFGTELDVSENVAHEIDKYIFEHAQGVFLWVHLVLCQLVEHVEEKGCSRREVLGFLKGLPTELEAMYKLLLETVQVEDREIGRRMFEWVLFVGRPLTAVQLQHALAIQSSPDISEESFHSEIIFPIEKRIIGCGRNLLEIKGLEEPVVQVMHQTVREFFLREDGHLANSRLRLSGPDAHAGIATSCLRYLILCTVNTPLQKDLPHPEQWGPKHFEGYAGYLSKWPLVRYALSHLKQHVHACGQSANVAQLVSQLCEGLTDSPAFYILESWIASHLGRNLATRERRLSFKDFKNNLLHAATRRRYSSVVETLLIVNADIEARSQDKTPLMVSAELGDVATTRVLLGLRAHLGAKDGNKRTALHLAAANGHSSIVKLLGNLGAEIEARDKDGQTALHIAARSNRVTTVQVLVQTLGADKEAKDENKRTALHLAAADGHSSIVKLLGNLGAEIEARDEDGQTALHVAATGGHDTVIQLLIETLGTNKEAKDVKLNTALHYAAVWGHEGTVELLVNKFGANREAEGCQKWSPLHYAAALGRERLVRMLVNSMRVNKTALDEQGQTALDRARECLSVSQP